MPRSSTALAIALFASLLTACGSTVAAPGGATAGAAQPGAVAPGADGLGDGLGDGLSDGLETPSANGAGAASAGGAAIGPPGTSDQSLESTGGASGPGVVQPGVGSSGSTAGGQSQPGTGQGPAAGPAPTGPLRFGLLTIKDAGAAVGAVGGNLGNKASEGEWARAMIGYLNDNGGIAGRELVPVEYEIDPQSNNYEGDLAAACARFTQDNQLPVVLSQSGYLWSASYQACLSKGGAAHLLSSGANGEQAQLEKFPALFNIWSPTPERRTRGLLTGLHASGYLTSKNTIGVIVENCPESVRTYDSTFAPLAKRLGLKVEKRTTNCLRGFSDVGSFQAQVQAAVLPFRSAGVDRVIFLSPWEAVMLLFFENQARSQGYAPSYALTSNGGTNTAPDNFGPEVLARMRGMGWAPTYDTTAGAATAKTPVCTAAAKRAGYSVENALDRTFLLTACEHFLVFKAAVEAAGGRADSASLSTGLAKASPSYTSVLQLGGRSLLGNGRQTAPGQVAEFAYVGECSCFRYVNAPRKLD
jgi:hypothetical protein